MFDLDRFVADCQAAIAQDKSHKAVQEVLARAIADPGAVRAALGEASSGGKAGGRLQKLYGSPELTILDVVWPAHMTIQPHNHQMWALIGMYDGREDNIFWRRLEGGRIEAAGARSLSTGDVTALGRDIIHSVTNPIPRPSGAIHIYGGAFFDTPRSEWNPETLAEQAFDVEAARRKFADA